MLAVLSSPEVRPHFHRVELVDFHADVTARKEEGTPELADLPLLPKEGMRGAGMATHRFRSGPATGLLLRSWGGMDGRTARLWGLGEEVYEGWGRARGLPWEVVTAEEVRASGDEDLIECAGWLAKKNEK